MISEQMISEQMISEHIPCYKIQFTITLRH